jgi:hypothetical protein
MKTLWLLILLIALTVRAELSDSVRDWAIDFVTRHEGGYVLYKGIDYNYGLSGKYYGNVRHISQDSAVSIYRHIWLESNAGIITDSCMALVYYDTYVMFTPTAARALLADCYDPRSYLLKRLALQMDNLSKCPVDKQRLHLIAWNRRIVDLFKLCQ